MFQLLESCVEYFRRHHYAVSRRSQKKYKVKPGRRTMRTVYLQITAASDELIKSWYERFVAASDGGDNSDDDDDGDSIES